MVALWKGTSDWDPQIRAAAFWTHVVFVFAFTKVVKLMGLFRKHPSDIVFLPVSILFGYFHGLIKLYALCTLKTVCIGCPQT